MKYFIVILIIVLLFAFFVYWAVYLPKNLSFQPNEVFLVKKGETLKNIAFNLQNQGLIKSQYFFIGYVFFKNKTQNLKAGEYELSSSSSVSKIAQKIYSGERIKKTITIVEGWTVEDIEEYLGMGQIDKSLEGYLFPDTYEIYPDDKLEDIIGKMQDNFNEKTKTLDLGQRSLSDIITMASILEKEVITLEDKKIVAGILWKRLEVKMPLQVDAEPDTYKYLGLPERPISNPGIESIEAAIHPLSTQYWYYLSTPEDKTIFSTTLKEHEQARRDYLK